jgi:hypothetical protein
MGQVRKGKVCVPGCAGEGFAGSSGKRNQPLVPSVSVVQIHMGLDRDEQVDNPDDKRSEQRPQDRYVESGNDILGEVDNDGADDEADDPPIVGGDTIAKHRFDDPAQQGNDNSCEKSCPEAANGKARYKKSDKHQDYGSDDKADDMAIVLEMSEEKLDTVLWPARHQKLVERVEGAYRFVHDRVQEAAYALIPEHLRGEAHLRIGRLLAARTSPEKRDEAAFEIVNQLNRALPLFDSTDEREKAAEFNLTAGPRANASTAYVSALSYFVAGRSLLAEDCWKRRWGLIFALDFHRAKCALLTGALSDAESHWAALSARVTHTADRAVVARLGIDLYVKLNQPSRSVGVGIEYLSHLEIHWSPHPTDEEARLTYQRVWSELDRHATEELKALPVMTDPASRRAGCPEPALFASTIHRPQPVHARGPPNAPPYLGSRQQRRVCGCLCSVWNDRRAKDR